MIWIYKTFSAFFWGIITYPGTFALLFTAVEGFESDSKCGETRADAHHKRQYIDVPEAVKCQWTISAPIGATIKLEVFGTGNYLELCNSHVQVWDGLSTYDEALKPYCDKTALLPTYYSQGNTLTVRSVDGKSFRLGYVAGAYWPEVFKTVELKATVSRQSLASPKPPDGFRGGVTMSWRISSGYYNKAIFVDVISSRLRHLLVFKTCMEAFDGYNSSSPSLKRWCNHETPQMTSSGNYMYILYSTSNLPNDFSFLLEYQLAEGTIGDEKDSGGLGIPAIAGIFVGVIAAIGLTVLIVKIVCSHLDSDGDDRLDHVTSPIATRQPLTVPIVTNTENGVRTEPSAPLSPSDVSFREPPPSYEDVFNMDSPKDDPPPYSPSFS